MLPPSISAAVAEARINHLIAEAESARQVRAALDAAASTQSRRRRPQLERRVRAILIAFGRRPTSAVSRNAIDLQ